MFTPANKGQSLASGARNRNVNGYGNKSTLTTPSGGCDKVYIPTEMLKTNASWQQHVDIAAIPPTRVKPQGILKRSSFNPDSIAPAKHGSSVARIQVQRDSIPYYNSIQHNNRSHCHQATIHPQRRKVAKSSSQVTRESNRYSGSSANIQSQGLVLLEEWPSDINRKTSNKNSSIKKSSVLDKIKNSLTLKANNQKQVEEEEQDPYPFISQLIEHNTAQRIAGFDSFNQD